MKYTILSRLILTHNRQYRRYLWSQVKVRKWSTPKVSTRKPKKPRGRFSISELRHILILWMKYSHAMSVRMAITAHICMGIVSNIVHNRRFHSHLILLWYACQVPLYNIVNNRSRTRQKGYLHIDICARSCQIKVAFKYRRTALNLEKWIVYKKIEFWIVVRSIWPVVYVLFEELRWIDLHYNGLIVWECHCRYEIPG